MVLRLFSPDTFVCEREAAGWIIAKHSAKNKSLGLSGESFGSISSLLKALATMFFSPSK